MKLKDISPKKFVIQHKDGKWLANTVWTSFTSNPKRAKKFASREEAEEFLTQDVKNHKKWLEQVLRRQELQKGHQLSKKEQLENTKARRSFEKPLEKFAECKIVLLKSEK